MIALTLGLLLSQAIYILLATSSRANATQLAFARLQENGRVAIDMLAADLRMAGHLPCGARPRIQVFSDALVTHVTGGPAIAAPPPVSVAGLPYPLDRGIFISGNTCVGRSCAPLLASGLAVPKPGLAVGNRIPGTDAFTVRYVQGDGLPAVPGTATGACVATGNVESIAAAGLAGGGFPAGHLALLASCTSAQIFAVDAAGSSVRPTVGKFGIPKCGSVGPQPRLFDVDEQLLTSTYYLQLVQDEGVPSRRIATLMRRTNGVVNEVVQGVERLDLRYSLHDRGGDAHWLTASQIDADISAGGAPVQCETDTVVRRCSWEDVEAVDVALLVNSIDDLPFEDSPTAWNYRYSIDGDEIAAPTATMPATGLPAGRMLRREFRTTVALKSLAI